MKKLNNRVFIILICAFSSIFLLQLIGLIINHISPLYICIAIIYSCFSIVLIQREFINIKRLVVETLFYISVSFFCISFSFYTKTIIGMLVVHFITAAILIYITTLWQLTYCLKTLNINFDKFDLIRRILFFILFELAVLYIVLFLPEQYSAMHYLKAIGLDVILLFQYIFPLIVGNILTYYIIYYFEAANKHETQKDTRQKAHKQFIWKTAIILFASACFILLSFIFMFEIKNITFNFLNTSLIEKVGMLLFVVWIVFLILLRVTRLKTKIKFDKFLKPLSITSTVILYLILNVLLITHIFQNYTYHSIPVLFLGLFVLSTACVAFGASNIISNRISF